MANVKDQTPRTKKRAAKPGDERLVALFLDMLAAERGADENTLAAYGRDLGDFAAYLAAIGRTVAKAATDDVRALSSTPDQARASANNRRPAVVGDPPALSIPLRRRHAQGRSCRSHRGTEAHARAAEDAHARRSRSLAAHGGALRSRGAAANAPAHGAALLPGRASLRNRASRFRTHKLAGLGGPPRGARACGTRQGQ